MKRKLTLICIIVLITFAFTTIVAAQEGRVGTVKEGLLTIMSTSSGGSMTVDDSLTPQMMAEDLVGSEVIISNVSYTGDVRGSGSFVGASTYLGIDAGIILASGRVIDVVGPNLYDDTTYSFGALGDIALDTLIPGYSTNDATILEFDFECPPDTGGEDVISFYYVFASEEYNEYVNTAYNDVFGFFLNGTNIALLPDGITPVSINNVNNGFSLGGGLPGASPSNPAYYINNDLNDGGGSINIEADGLTVVLGAEAPINPGSNHMKLAIADAGDFILDSWVFIQGESFQCAPLNDPPVADANGPYSVQEDLTIALDGTGSFDPNDDVLEYSWDLDDNGTFETTGATPVFSHPDPGIYPVTLKVCDAYACDTDTVYVYVTIEPGLFPQEVTAYLIAGESFTENKTVNVPPRPPKADIVFAFDLTGSMYEIIDTAKSRAGDIMSQLNAISGVEIQFGLMSYMDYPGYFECSGYAAPYGFASDGDYAYNLDHPVTNDTTQIALDINALTLGNGGDGPQDYARIFYESYSDPSVGWRDGAKKILLNFGDNVPHDDNLNEGVSGSVWSTGCDPGRDEIAGTSDDLDLQTVLAEMDSAGVVLLESHTTDFANDNWQYWTGLTGGDVFITSSTTLVDDIVGSITSTLEAGMVYGLHLEASPGFEDWIATDTKDVDPGEIGVSVPFEAVFTVPAGTEPGEYTFTVYAVDEDGVIYGEQTVTIHVLPPSTVTNSSLCTFDVLPEEEGDQFRLIFTPDLQNWPQYKLPASNPGQFYYNVFYAGDGPVNLEISIPYPFEGQGANPVHIYRGRTVHVYDNMLCFEPDYDSEIYAGTLADLPSDLPGGFLYVAVHLDYGLKGTTGYEPSGDNDALDATDGTTVLIPNFNDYIFSVSGSQNDSQIIQNSNDFKKIPGFGGLVLNSFGDPLHDQTIKIYLAGELFDTVQTDEDGWYMLVYKHLGKPVDFKVEWVNGGQEVTGTLKANKFIEANFPVP